MGRNVREDLGGVGGGKEYDKNKLYEILKKKNPKHCFSKRLWTKMSQKFFSENNPE